MLIQIKVPKSVGLKSKIVDKYTFLYKEYRRFYPDRRDYTYRQLRHNILEVAAIVNSFVDDSDIHNTTFNPWQYNKWKQLYYKHWYFAVTVIDIDGVPTAIIHDAHYEGDHHNDMLLSMPYENPE